MDKIKRGKKHICSKCETKFYDLGKLDIICPKCGNKVLYKLEKHSISPKPKDEKKLNAEILEEEDTNFDGEVAALDEELDDKEIDNIK